eukprot:augustus_masked-scaffold_4-processed-gene-10.40-mRNA-1 protein AED:0.36 eAED:0.36 QI:0/-1/0/1/-1/1/1/0/585
MTSYTPKYFLNDNENAVKRSLLSYVKISKDFQVLEGFNKVVVLSNSDKEVKLISGGGSGHEPAHVGYIAQNMLDGAVCGDIFSSPSVAQVKSAILALSSKGESNNILLIVKNYTGDRLNFGIAAEKCRTLGIDVEVLVVNDDVSFSMESKAKQARGLAGVVLVHKILGSLKNRSLKEVKKFGQKVVNSIGTIGVSFDECLLPFTKRNNEDDFSRLSPSDGLVEVGMGIHGEPGKKKISFTGCKDLVQHMLQQILDRAVLQELKTSRKAVLLVNNLGCVTDIEMEIILKEALAWAAENNIILMRIVSGKALTSLRMHGFSLSLLVAEFFSTEEWGCCLSGLDEVTDAPGWNNLKYIKCETRIIPIEKPVDSWEEKKDGMQYPLSDSISRKLYNSVQTAAKKLLQERDEINRIDKMLGDGDCGSTFAKGAALILKLKPNSFQSVENILLSAISICEQMGGSSGAVLTLFFMGAMNSLKASTEDASKLLIHLLQQGNETIQKHAGTEVGMRTLFDILKEFEILLTNKEDGVVEKLKIVLDNTTTMEAKAGRTMYLNLEQVKQTKLPDPGALAVFLFIESFYSTFYQPK